MVPGSRPDVGAPVSADLRLVAHPTHRNALEGPAHRLGHGAAERGLAHSRRADEAQDRGARVGLELAHRQELENAVLDALDVVVVAIERLTGVSQVEVVLARLGPGQAGQPLEVGPDHAVLRRLGREVLEARQLTLGLLHGVLGQARLVELPAQLLGLDLLLVLLAQLVLDGLELLAQEPLALALVHLRLHLRLDAGADLHQLELAGEYLGEHPQPLGHIALFEEGLLLLGLDSEGPGDHVRELGRVVEVRHRHEQLLGQVGELLDYAREGALNVAVKSLELGRGAHDVRRLLDAGHEVRLGGRELLDGDPLSAVDEDAQGAVRDLEHPGHHARHPDPVQVVGPRLLDLPVLRGDHHQHPVAGESVVDERDRTLLADCQRGQRLRKGDRLAQRQHGQVVGQARLHLGGDGLPLACGDVDAHPSSMGTRRTLCSGRASGISTSSVPSSYEALAASATTSAPSSTSLRKGPCSISICW